MPQEAYLKGLKMMDELRVKKCQCGNKPIFVERDNADIFTDYYFECPVCEKRSIGRMDIKQAVDEWNKRI